MLVLYCSFNRSNETKRQLWSRSYDSCIFNYCDHTGGVMVSMLASSAVDHGFEPRTGQTKDYKLIFVASLLSMQQ